MTDYITDSLIAFLIIETPYSLWREDKIDILEDLPKGWRGAIDESEAINQRHDDEGISFHENGGSLFSDYKNLRKKSGMKLGAFSKDLKADMTKDEILAVAEKEIEKWKRTVEG